MQISTRGRYGLRAMVDMALHSAEGPLALHVIAERQGISESYLEQVFTILRKAGLVKALRGAQGGYELSRPTAEISTREIVESLEGPLTLVQCIGDSPASQCGREKSCITRFFWAELSAKIADFLEHTTLQDLAERARAQNLDEPMYFI